QRAHEREPASLHPLPPASAQLTRAPEVGVGQRPAITAAGTRKNSRPFTVTSQSPLACFSAFTGAPSVAVTLPFAKVSMRSAPLPRSMRSVALPFASWRTRAVHFLSSLGLRIEHAICVGVSLASSAAWACALARSAVLQ